MSSSVAARGGAPAEHPRNPRRSRRLRTWIPPQHGVWAMLLLPYLAALRFGADWVHVPLLVGWLTGWLLSYHALTALKTGRWRRATPQMLAYGAVSAACLVPVLVVRPALAWFVPGFVVLLGIDAVLTRIGQERSTGNGLVSVTMAAQMALIVPVAAGEPWRTGIPVAIVTWLYLAGTVAYVKSMIREYGSRTHYAISVGYHVVALGAATIIDWRLAIPFTIMLARAVILPRRARMKAPVIGALEVMITLVLLGFALFAPPA